jgi:sugar (pentulose or hexulose) kinase
VSSSTRSSGCAAAATASFDSQFPQLGWVAHDPEEIWATVVEAADAAVHDAGVRAADLRAVGINESARDDAALGARGRNRRAPLTGEHTGARKRKRLQIAGFVSVSKAA